MRPNRLGCRSLTAPFVASCSDPGRALDRRASFKEKFEFPRVHAHLGFEPETRVLAELLTIAE